MNKQSLPILTLLLFGLFNVDVAQGDQHDWTVSVGHLRCEYRENPMGVDRNNPLLSWWITSDQRGENQAAYQILVASDTSLLAQDNGDLWDSGKTASKTTIQIPYQGKPLASAQQVYWKVRSWDKYGSPTAWSDVASWEMGLLSEKDWAGAQWISGPIRSEWNFPKAVKPTSAPLPRATPIPSTPSPTSAQAAKLTDSILLKRDFTASRKVTRATLFACGLGQYEMFLNGKLVTDTFLDPGWSQYQKTCLYNSYNVTGLVSSGKNTLAALLGNSFFNMHPVPPGRYQKSQFKNRFEVPRLIARMLLEYDDGSTENIVSDASWFAAPGPLTLSHIYAGEDYDARLLPVNWNTPACSDLAWEPATLVSGPGGVLKGLTASAPPIRFFETLAPVFSKENKPGVTTYDFGQNAAVVLRMIVRGPAGSVIRVEPAEISNSNGKIATSNIRGNAHAYWEYTLKGAGDETYQGKFFYQGGRYFQVEQLPAPGDTALPEILKIEARVIQADSPAVGSFKCSNELFNRIWTLIRWAQRSNMVSIMTDCPAREKLGWLEEDHLNGPALHYNWNLGAEMGKILNDMSDAQATNGFVPTTAPTYASFGGGFLDSPEWGSSAVVVPWQMYQMYGDLNVLRDHYDMMKGYTGYLQGKSKTNIVSYGLGDWYDIGPKNPGRSQLTQLEITGTGYLYYDTLIVAQVARLLGKQDDAVAYSAKAKQINSDFNKTLFNQERGVYGTGTNYPVGSQCANALPLVFDLVESTNVFKVTEALIADIIARGNTGGDVGYRYVLRAVADAGRSDVIYAMNNQSDKPGYGMQLKKGATALTEPWSGSGASQNHFMLGQLNEWIFHDLAGIQPDPENPGFSHIIIKPAIVGDLTWVEATYESVHGPIRCRWDRKGNELNLAVTIPPNTTATIRVPITNLIRFRNRESSSPRPVGSRSSVLNPALSS